MKSGITDMGLPCACLTGYHETYHFMRPVNSAGNSKDENCWIYFTPDEKTEKPLHPDLHKAIDKLDITRIGKRKSSNFSILLFIFQSSIIKKKHFFVFL